MADLNIRLEIRLSPRILQWALAAFLISITAGELSSENVTLTTYYPAPSGVYNQMITTQATYLARDGGAVGIGTTSPGASGLVVMGGPLGIGTTSPGPGAGNITVSGDVAINGVLSANGGLAISNSTASFINGGLLIGVQKVPSSGGYGTIDAGDGSTSRTGVLVSRQVGTDCSFLHYYIGVQNCGGNQYIAFQEGLISKYVAGGPFVASGLGTALCCTCPTSGCPSLTN